MREKFIRLFPRTHHRHFHSRFRKTCPVTDKSTPHADWYAKKKKTTEDFPEMAEIEHLWMKMAEKQGIPTTLCGLVYLSSGERAYITRRFDRIQHEKIQVEDFCQLSEKSTSQKIPVLAKVLVKSLITILINPKMTNLLCFRCSCFLFG